MFYKDESLALFIDGTHLYAAAKANGFEIDYKLLRQEFMRRGKLLRAYYYAVTQERSEHDPIRPLIDWLDYNGYTVVTKQAREFTDNQNRKRIKGSIQVALAVDALEACEHINHAVIFAGDGDYLHLVESIKRHGVRVSIASTLKPTQSLVSDDLRRAADNFIELADLCETISKSKKKDERAPLELVSSAG